MVIYKITNLVNSKIGQTIQKDPRMRWWAHLANVRRGKHSVETKNKISKAHKKYNKIRKQNNEPTHWQVNESPFKGKTWKLIDGKRVWMEK